MAGHYEIILHFPYQNDEEQEEAYANLVRAQTHPPEGALVWIPPHERPQYRKR